HGQEEAGGRGRTRRRAGRRTPEEVRSPRMADEAPEKAAEKDESKAPVAPRKGGRKRERKEVRVGIAHVQATFNNTIVTLTDKMGNVVSWASAGSVGLKGSRQSTHFAAPSEAENGAAQAMDPGLMRVVQL